jgi:hypothetical protein
MKHIRLGLLMVMFLMQSCNLISKTIPSQDQTNSIQPTPALEQPSTTSTSTIPVLVQKPTLEEPSPIPSTAPATTLKATDTPTFEPPAGFKKYQDQKVGVSIYIPDSWVVTGIVDGQYAIFQSYPEDKYIGGEMFAPGDTNIRPAGIDTFSYMQQLKSSPTVAIVSEAEITLHSGQKGTRLEIDSMGRSIAMITEINARVVSLTCFGDSAPFDDIAVTLSASE